MFDWDDTRQIRLSDLLKNDSRLVTRKQYLQALQRQFQIVIDGEPTRELPPEVKARREHDKRLIKAYENQNAPELHGVAGFNVIIHRPE